MIAVSEHFPKNTIGNSYESSETTKHGKLIENSFPKLDEFKTPLKPNAAVVKKGNVTASKLTSIRDGNSQNVCSLL